MDYPIKVTLTLPAGTYRYSTKNLQIDGTGNFEGDVISIGTFYRGIGDSFQTKPFDLILSDNGTFKDMFDDTNNSRFFGSAVSVEIMSKTLATTLYTISAYIEEYSHGPGTLKLKCGQNPNFLDKTYPTGGVINTTDFPDAATGALGQVRQELWGSFHAHDSTGSVKCWRIAGSSINGQYFLSDKHVNEICLVNDNGHGVGVASYNLSNTESYSYVSYSSPAASDFIQVNCNGYDNNTWLSDPIDILQAILSLNSISYDSSSFGTVKSSVTSARGYAGSIALNTNIKLRDILDTFCWNFDLYWYLDDAGKIFLTKRTDSTSVVAHFGDEISGASDEKGQPNKIANRLTYRYEYQSANTEFKREDEVTATGSASISIYGDRHLKTEFLWLVGAWPTTTTLSMCNDRATREISATKEDKLVMTVEVPFWKYNQFCNLGNIVSITHPNQLGNNGQYRIMSEERNPRKSSVKMGLKKQ